MPIIIIIIRYIYIIIKQLPLCFSSGISVLKSQGLSLKRAVINAGNSIFTTGQIYVDLSRLISLKGLYLINYDPSFVKVNETTVIEYNRLRALFRPDLSTIKTVLVMHTSQLTN